MPSATRSLTTSATETATTATNDSLPPNNDSGSPPDDVSSPTKTQGPLGDAPTYALARAVEDGTSLRAAAGAFGVSPATACLWARRWRLASEEERATLVCLHDRSSRPRQMPRLLPAREQRRICAARRKTGWGPRLLTLATGHSHSTISKVLRRHGPSRPPRSAREPERRCEWPCPGDLLRHPPPDHEGPTGRARTGKSSVSIRRWHANGRTASATASIDPAPQPCHTGSTTTTRGNHTNRSAAYRRSAAFTTPVGTTARSARCLATGAACSIDSGTRIWRARWSGPAASADGRS